MRILGLESIAPISVLGIGNFDGFHVGHQRIAQDCDALLTFCPHPVQTLAFDPNFRFLTTDLELQTFFPRLLRLEFTREVAALSPVEFLDGFFGKVHPKRVVVGYDFHFGKDRSGAVSDLAAGLQKRGIELEIIQPVSVDGAPIKSSVIRRLLREAHFSEALRLLGHPYLLKGQVVAGEGRGRLLGFPTANIALPVDKLIPATGVYAGFVDLSSGRYRAMAYIGTRPTFHQHTLSVEAYLLDFEGDLYGETADVYLTRFIRPEQRFESEAALRAQIQQDIHASFSS